MTSLTPAPKGRHHRRHHAGRHINGTPPLRMSRSDVKWTAAVAALPILLLLTKPLPLTRVWVPVLLGGFVILALWRLSHHSGGRRFSGVNQTVQERAEEQLRNTAEIPVIEPTAMSPAPGMPPVAVRPMPRGWRPTPAQVVAFGIAAFVQGLSMYSEHQVREARRMDNANDALLGIPGAWNGYQPTIPAHGTRGWAPAPDAHHFSGGVIVPWQQPAQPPEGGQQQWKHPRLW